MRSVSIAVNLAAALSRLLQEVERTRAEHPDPAGSIDGIAATACFRINQQHQELITNKSLECS